MSQFFNDEVRLAEVDWDTVKLKNWGDTEEDPDRKRRKQAEFLVFDELLLAALLGVAVYDEATKSEVLTIFTKYGCQLPVVVRPKWYYK